MRIELKNNFDIVEVSDWMNKNVGEIEDEITWFWSTRNSVDCDNNVLVAEGIEIFKDNEAIKILAALKWQ